MSDTVMITGTSSGIGLATAVHLAELGYDVVACVRDAEKIGVVTSAAAEAGVEVEPLAFDVTDDEACREALDGRELYGLVNNAGYYNVGAIEDVPRQDALRQFDTMVVAPMRLAQLAMPAMRERGRGRIVNVTSGIVHTHIALTGWYQSCKEALIAASDALRIETAEWGVDVVQIEPGAINSDIWAKAEADLLRLRGSTSHVVAYDRALKILRALQGRMHPPTKVAEAIGAALSEQRPRRRYRVGIEAGLLPHAGALLPDAARDRVVRTLLGM